MKSGMIHEEKVHGGMSRGIKFGMTFSRDLLMSCISAMATRTEWSLANLLLSWCIQLSLVINVLIGWVIVC